jgi:hypothetical protein
MALIYPKQLRVSGSDLQSGRPTTGGGEYDQSYLNPSMSISDALNAVAIQGSGTIGMPDDKTYTDGYFDYWTSDTRIPNAFDDVNELLFKIAPDNAGLLTGEDLVLSSPSLFSGYLSAGLDSGSWYSFASPGDQLTNLSDNDSVNAILLVSPNQSDSFTGGQSASFIDLVGDGGVTASLSTGSQVDFSSLGQRDLFSGEGATGQLNVTDISTYNNIWLKVNAEITGTFSVTGSNRYKMSADNGAGETNPYLFQYAGTSADSFPTQSFSVSPYTSSLTPAWKYLSGMPYYSSGTILDINYVGQDLYNPIYSQGDESYIQSSYFTNVTVTTSSVNPPTHSWDLTVTQSVPLSNNVKTTYNALGTFFVRLVKPGKSDTTSAATDIGYRPINTYLTRSTDLLEYFDDEDKRWTSITSQSWNNQQTLFDGRLETNNGRLISGKWGSYGGVFFTDGEQFYYRPFTPTNANENGTIVIARSGFSGLSNIMGVWSGSDDLQMAFVMASETGSTVYDLGRAVGANSGSIKGIRDSISGDTITWGLPPGKQTTNSDPVILMVRFNDTINSDYLTQLTVTFDQG